LQKKPEKIGITNQMEWEKSVDDFLNTSSKYTVGASSIGLKHQLDCHTCCICEFMDIALTKQYDPTKLINFLGDNTEEVIK
jgi:hypothetical protein